MSLKDTPEWQQHKKMFSAKNRVLCEVFDIPKRNIIRYENPNSPHILDQEFAIDLKVKLKNGMNLSGQEKALSYKFYSFRTFTIEFWQNRYTEEPGEWFKIACQFYLHGYSDETGKEFAGWYILKMFDFMNWIKQKSIYKLKNKLKPASGSRAAFLPIKYDKIPDYIIYASGRGPRETKVYDDPKSLNKKSAQIKKTYIQSSLF